MDKRLELTEKQKSVIKKLADVFKELQEEKVGIVSCQDHFTFDGFKFYNASDVISSDILDTSYVEGDIEDYFEVFENSGEEAEEGQIWYTPPFGLEFMEVQVDQMESSDYWFSLLMERTEDTDIFFRKREKANELAPLMEKRKKLEKEMKRYVDALADGEENLHRLEEKGLPQEIIDEEREKINTTKKDLEELNSKIKELDGEIRKVKAKKVK